MPSKLHPSLFPNVQAFGLQTHVFFEQCLDFFRMLVQDVIEDIGGNHVHTHSCCDGDFLQLAVSFVRDRPSVDSSAKWDECHQSSIHPFFRTYRPLGYKLMYFLSNAWISFVCWFRISSRILVAITFIPTPVAMEIFFSLL